MKTHEPIPKTHPVQPLRRNQHAEDRATCGHCGLSWDDAICTSWTPTPSGRCPFEYFHLYPEPKPNPTGKPTAGPWRAQGLEVRAPSPGLNTLAVCQESESTTGSGKWYVTTRKECEANARLMASAPELLEACQTALANLAPKYSSEHLVMKRLRAAIAKAEGSAGA